MTHIATIPFWFLDLLTSLLHQVAIMERMGDSMRLLEVVLPR